MNKKRLGLFMLLGGLACLVFHGPLAIAAILIIGGAIVSNQR